MSIYDVNIAENSIGKNNGVCDNMSRIICYTLLILIPMLLLAILPIYKYSYDGKNKWLWVVSYYQLVILIPFFRFFSAVLFIQ